MEYPENINILEFLEEVTIRDTLKAFNLELQKLEQLNRTPPTTVNNYNKIVTKCIKNTLSALECEISYLNPKKETHTEPYLFLNDRELDINIAMKHAKESLNRIIENNDDVADDEKTTINITAMEDLIKDRLNQLAEDIINTEKILKYISGLMYSY